MQLLNRWSGSVQRLERLRFQLEIAAALLSLVGAVGVVWSGSLAAALSGVSASLVIVCVGPLGRQIAVLQQAREAEHHARLQRAETADEELRGELRETRERLRRSNRDLAELNYGMGRLEELQEQVEARAERHLVDALRDSLRE